MERDTSSTPFARVALASVLSASLALAGCGSGSSSSPTTPDPTGDTPPADPPVTAEKITLSGTVTDMPIPNANVFITVNGQTFDAPLPTDAEGNYSVEIESEDPDAMVLCEAYDPNGVARFAAMLNNFAGLQASADDAGVVPEADITNVTTAQFVLAQRMTDDGSIDSLDELESASEEVDANELLELSAAIKLVVESIEGISLPADVEDTYALAEAIVAGESTFLDDVELTNPGALDDAQELVLTDGNATIPFDAATAAGVYLVEETFTLYALFEDGTGLMAAYDEDLVDYLPSWNVTADGQLQIDFEEAYQERDVLTLLNRAGNVLSVVTAYEDLSGEAETEMEPATAIYFAFSDGWDPATVAGSYNSPEDEDEFLVFAADGTGYELIATTGMQDDSFTWEVDESGALVLSELGSNEVDVAYLLAGSDGVTLNLLTVDNADPVEMQLITVTRTDQVFTGAVSDEANFAMLAGKTYALTDEDDVALLTFAADNMLTEIAQFLDDAGGWDVYEDEGFWTIDADGVVTTTFEDEGGELESEDATVLSGLGTSVMTVRTQDDDANEETTVTLVVPFDASALAGTYDFVDEAGQIDGEIMVLQAGGVGSYQDEDDAEEFQWVVDGDGRLALTLLTQSVDAETDTFYLLADSTDDLLHAVFVFRVNGQLDRGLSPQEEEAGETPEAVEEVFLQRRSD